MADFLDSIERLLNEKVVQISLISGILFFIVANSQTFSIVENLFKQVGGIVGLKLNLKGNALLVFHSLVFAVLLALVIKYIFEPFFYDIVNGGGPDNSLEDLE